MCRLEVALGSDDCRSPQVVVLVNGVAVSGIMDVEVTSNNHLAANRYRVRGIFACQRV